MKDLFCIDRHTGVSYMASLSEIHNAMRELNSIFKYKGCLSINEVYDIINKSLPEDKQIRPNLHGWAHDIGYMQKVGDDEFCFGFEPVFTNDGGIILNFSCHTT